MRMLIAAWLAGLSVGVSLCYICARAYVARIALRHQSEIRSAQHGAFARGVSFGLSVLGESEFPGPPSSPVMNESEDGA